jgi:hypothetical protein
MGAFQKSQTTSDGLHGLGGPKSRRIAGRPTCFPAGSLGERVMEIKQRVKNQSGVKMEKLGQTQ